MSFGTSGFSGFGQQGQQQQSSGFGGFGNTTSGSGKFSSFLPTIHFTSAVLESGSIVPGPGRRHAHCQLTRTLSSSYQASAARIRLAHSAALVRLRVAAASSAVRRPVGSVAQAVRDSVFP